MILLSFLAALSFRPLSIPPPFLSLLSVCSPFPSGKHYSTFLCFPAFLFLFPVKLFLFFLHRIREISPEKFRSIVLQSNSTACSLFVVYLSTLFIVFPNPSTSLSNVQQAGILPLVCLQRYSLRRRRWHRFSRRWPPFRYNQGPYVVLRPSPAALGIQTQPTTNPIYSGTWDCCKQTYRHEGFKGFYKGCASPLVGTCSGLRSSPRPDLLQRRPVLRLRSGQAGHAQGRETHHRSVLRCWCRHRCRRHVCLLPTAPSLASLSALWISSSLRSRYRYAILRLSHR